MRSPSPHRCRRSRVVAAVVLVLFACGWLTHRAHTVFEQHAWCDEHQRVEHHDALGAHADAGEALAGDRGPAIEPIVPDPDGHAACCVLLARNDDPVTPPDVLREPSWFPVGVAPVRASPTQRAAVAPIPLVLLAPKQSPPAV